MRDFISKLDYLIISGLFAGLCGALSYLLKVEENRKFVWSEFILHTIISAVFGLIAFEILIFEGFPPELCGALCGMAGWFGTRIVKIIEIMIRKKLGITKREWKD